jgi:hypothetical protein
MIIEVTKQEVIQNHMYSYVYTEKGNWMYTSNVQEGK